jgi:hypothetical protein
MPHGNKTVRLSEFVLKQFDLFVVDFSQLAAFQANEVVMVLVVQLRLEPCLALADFYLIGDAAVTHQPQIPMDRRISDIGIFFSYAVKELINSNVFAGREKGAKDYFALASVAQTVLGYILFKHLFCLAYI